ncbi:MAG: alpha/beta hydrolase [Roseateles depolymerans]|uniref:Alpha/beta hydrolase n=1 Tax=Roseateles depolymerans TaxID=76731 RepID=A0A2W5E6J1_9BURK|nr:MAG: alpha/beta hydrolase [Roseateles depolymerans]
MGYRPPRVLIIPGLHDSGPAHWQTWLQAQYRDARRVTQRDPGTPALERWAERIQRTLEVAGDGEWLAVAHSFGALALVRHLADHPDSPIREALLVAPAEPDKFGLAEALPHERLPRRTRLIASSNDPWMSAASAARWAHRWGSSFSNLGAVGHVNTESGFGPFPLAKAWVDSARQRAAAEQRPQHASFLEWGFAI